jgi:hypothetical protein
MPTHTKSYTTSNVYLLCMVGYTKKCIEVCMIKAGTALRTAIQDWPHFFSWAEFVTGRCKIDRGQLRDETTVSGIPSKLTGKLWLRF